MNDSICCECEDCWKRTRERRRQKLSLLCLSRRLEVQHREEFEYIMHLRRVRSDRSDRTITRLDPLRVVPRHPHLAHLALDLLMWDDEEIKGEMREMRMARDDAERIEARNGAVASVGIIYSNSSRCCTSNRRERQSSESFCRLRSLVLFDPKPSVVEDADDAAEVGIEEDEGAETAEAFATLPLARSAPRRPSPSSSRASRP
jgi:hypothetical protein